MPNSRNHPVKDWDLASISHLSIRMQSWIGLECVFTFGGSQRVITHLSFDTARIPAIATGYDALFQYFIQHRVMKRCFLPRGE